MLKSMTTLRLPNEKLRILKAIAGYENRTLTDIFSEVTDEYIKRHKETLELLGIPGFVAECKSGLEEIKTGKGKTLNELDS